MSASENKKLIQDIFAELGKGNSRPFIERMAEDFCWTITGSNQWSRSFAGKQAVVGELFGALRAALAPPIITVGVRFIADEDYVAVEAQGRNTTKNGIAYNNRYCFVFRLTEGKLREVTEYMDTELVRAALPAPEFDRAEASSERAS